ncbi:threonine transporter RhtB [Candidatus Riesia sp. GBBU]|nr:threonine transporter RhtB [Candidatus Riesia sp. GBBU]ARC55054.1 threonine transporter RhtB [Candidatus Riesia sp. GBBU]
MLFFFKKKRKVLFPTFLLLFAMISIQSGAFLAKKLFPIIGTFGVTALRLFLATITLLAMFKPWQKRINTKSIVYLIIYGISLGSMNSLFYLSLERIPLGIAVALEFTGPLSIAIFSSRKLIDFFWISIIILGLIFLLPLSKETNSLNLSGILYALAAGFFWGMYIIFGRKSSESHGYSTTVSIGSLISTAIFFPIGVFKVGIQHLFDFSIFPIAIAVSFLSTTFPYTVEMFVLTKMSSKTFGKLMSLEPVIGAFIGITFLNEKLTGAQWLSLLCIIIASVGSSIEKMKQ